MGRFVTLVAAAVMLASQGARAGELTDWDGPETAGTIVIDTSDRRLNYIVGDGTAVVFPVAVGREGMQWKGQTRVTHMRWSPEWRPTERMRRENPRLPAVVKPGPSNPLGVAAIYLAEGLLRIHGTNQPSSIGKAASSGCFRMHNEDVTELYDLVEPGASVIVRR